MDVSFTNVLEGARQYFQGLPAPSTSGSSGSTLTSTTTTTTPPTPPPPLPQPVALSSSSSSSLPESHVIPSSSQDHGQPAGTTSKSGCSLPASESSSSSATTTTTTTATTTAATTTTTTTTTSGTNSLLVRSSLSNDKPEYEDAHASSSYWNSSSVNPGMRSMVEPYAPQPTRVEVPDTRPPESQGETNLTTTCHSLTEMQTSIQQRLNAQKQLRQQQASLTEGTTTADAIYGNNMISRNSPNLHQMQPAPKRAQSPPPIYQQLNNVSRPASSSSISNSYTTSEILNSHAALYQVSENRTTNVPIVAAQRTQYYPRYHHPDITKSTPVPFTQSTNYHSGAPPLATSLSSTHQPTTIRPSTVESSNSPISRQRTQRENNSSEYPCTLPTPNHGGSMSAYPISGLSQNIGNYRGSSSHSQQSRTSNLTGHHLSEHYRHQHHHHQTPDQQIGGASHPSSLDGSNSGHTSSSVPSSPVMSASANTCSPRYGNPTGHIPSPHNNHPGHIPSPHLPTASLSLPASSSATTALHPMAQQVSQQFSHPSQHPSRIGPTVGPLQSMNASSYTSRGINPYTTGTPTCYTSMMSPQQILPPPPSSSSSSSSSSTSSSSSAASSVSPSITCSASSTFSSCHPTIPQSASLEQNHHATPSSPRQSPHVSVMHNSHVVPSHPTSSPHHATPSPHHHTPSPSNPANFQPQSPSYPPPAPPSSLAPSTSQRVPPSAIPSNPYNIPASSQQYRSPANYPNPYQATAHHHHHHNQPSYHSHQKNNQQQQQPHSVFNAQPSNGRSQYGHAAISGSGGSPSTTQNTGPIDNIGASTNNSNGPSYQTTGHNRTVTYNGDDSNRSGVSSGNPTTSYNSYRMEQSTGGRTSSSGVSNTHNLPPIASVSSYHSNRGARDSNLCKTQAVNRQRIHSSNGPVNNAMVVVSSASQPMTGATRVSEYSPSGASSNHSTLVTNEITAIGGSSNHSRYGGQQNYSSYATTIAPSRHGNNSLSSSNNVTSLGRSGIRSAVPSAMTGHNRTGAYSPQRIATDNIHAYKDYTYGNSQLSNEPSQPGQMEAVPPVQPTPHSNGLPPRKRESPLDLSVKTIKTPADSTARDDLDSCVIEKHVSSTNMVVPSKNNGPRVMLPPSVQPTNPTTAYVNYDTRNFNGARNPINSCIRASTPQPVCAPKVDFLPDFNATSLSNRHHNSQHHQQQYHHQQQQQQQHHHHNHHHHHHHQSGSLHGNPESLRRTSSRQMYEPPQQNSANLPPRVASFKKTSLAPAQIYDGKNPSTSYSAMQDDPSGVPRQTSQRHPTIVEPARPGATVLLHQEYPSPNLSKYYHSESRGKFPLPSAASATSAASSASALSLPRERVGSKRPAEPLYAMSGSTPNKQPRLDPWRLAIDKQIQQKLSSAKELLEKKQEMNMSAPLENGALMSSSSYSQRTDNTNSPSDTNRYQAYCDKRNYPDNMIPVSPTSYNHPIPKTMGIHPISQASASQTSYSGYRQSQRTQYAVGPGLEPPDQPSNTGADKRVLSLLRNSLESKQQREEQLHSQQPILVSHAQQSFQNKVVAPVEPKTNMGRHNLSPFTAASLLERNSNTPPHYKFHVPRAVDSITQEAPRSLYGSRVNSSATLPGKEALLGPRGTDNQIHRDKDDGLAAILAAKIRTKGELKQVCSSQFATKPTTLPSQQVSVMPDVSELEGSSSTSTPQSVGSSAASPPKLTREKTACAVPPRRRLFSRNEEENMPVAATIPAPAPIIAEASTVAARSSGFRSSSETSVFDFRESDSEGEMPVLERQTLEEMRRDRKQLSKVQPPVPLNDAMRMDMTSSTDLVKIELKENDKKVTEIDPFWSATCDKFMEQLRSGDSTKKRGRKKKIGESSKPDGGPEDEESKEATMEQPSETQIKPEDIKQEIIEVDHFIADKVLVEETGGTDTAAVVVKSEPKETTNVKEEVKEVKGATDVVIEVAKREGEEGEEEEEEEERGEEEEEEKNSGEESDELPLIKRTAKNKYKKKAESDCDDDVICRKRRVRRGSRIKLESSSGSESSSDEESDVSAEFGRDTSVAHRLRARKRTSTSAAAVANEGMKLRSRDTTPHKVKQEKDSKNSPAKGNGAGAQKLTPKPLFGDGSDFRPGWEAEVYVYKKSLRMPPRLITVSKPSRFHRLSTSLPDLDPGSPALSVSMDSSDVCLGRKRNVDSDLESNYSFSISGLLGTGGGKIDDEEATSSTTISCPPKTSGRHNKAESNGTGSIVDLLARKVGGAGKKDAKKKLKEKLERGGKVLPKATNEPELLPTPNLTPLVSNETRTKLKGKTPVKNYNKSTKPINVTDSYLLGYFRKETVNNFRNTFKNNHALPNEFSTFVLKSRTRTETRVLKKQATIREVFGEERPASAPPMQNHAGDTSQDDDSQTEIRQNLLGRTRKLKQKVVTRLRNVGILRSQKAIMNSKRHLLTAKKRKDLIKSLAEKTLESLKKRVKDEKKSGAEDKEEEEDVTVVTPEEEEEDEEEEEEEPEINKPEGDNNDDTEIPSKKKLKLRTGRRKFRSGFDYIRKKKKPLKKEDATPKERKRAIITRPNAECVADIQSEIRTWVIKKGVGETILHRAARLGYTDVTAYCLEKLSSAPSPKDNAGYTPLHEACSRGHLEIARLLLAYGANVSESANGGIRPLHEAAENGATELVRLLLSYGADPLLATYSGQTPLMLAVDTEAYSILEHHLNDVQGRSTIPWSFGGPSSIFDPEGTGYNPLEDPPISSPEPELEEIEMEVSDVNLPVLFTLVNDPDKWVLLQDLMTALRVKSRDALLRQVNPKAPSGPPSIAHRDVMRELKLHDFLEQSRCCHLLSGGERINVRGSKVTLIKYNEKVRSLLNVERVVINLR
ncbi:pneumococcal serine-rich repeat protein isoform X3 [Venturia canescens]|uniref:pneumococcal serine-rich repeat protein isoform X3 n=1 Tax=Venturia canescens TaxID=32260 RepID=UPI001C9BD669|nr:pneumococcal serine-rich repeat protein-like isoform X3 [Venturia canescens]